MRSDEQLILAILQGDKTAYATLIRRYEVSVRAIAVRILHNVHDAQDVAQDVFIKAYQKLPSLKKRETFGPWLLKVARNTALDFLRKEVRRPILNPLDESALSDHHDTLNQEHEELLRAVMELPKQEQRVIMLKHFDSHTAKDIATLTGQSVGTVTKQLSRAYARLRKMIPEMKP